jgi:hypothetical protein
MLATSAGWTHKDRAAYPLRTWSCNNGSAMSAGLSGTVGRELNLLRAAF